MDLILGTAGHIDHGKTTLVAALTGIDCDRLDEEKRRGITIELGFAWLDLPDGGRLGIVDVPGHERFVKNMVAGATGMDCALLVVAADEGVMPQTAEHLEICSLLGVRSGLVALTKADLVDDELLALAKDDVKSALAGSFLANAPIIPVSAVTGLGLDELKREIINTASRASRRSGADIFRLPVDRVFTMRGFGTVVTGTIASGSCATGEKLCVASSGKTGRARNLQVHGQVVESASAGRRCAINLQGLDVADIQRGDDIARPGTLFPSRSWIIRLTCLESSPLPIRQRMEVHFHHGAGECLAKIVFKDRDKLEPGQTALAEARFDRPRGAIYGDRCVLRAHSPLRAIGGGPVISPLPPDLSRRKGAFSRNWPLLEKLAEPASNDAGLLAAHPPADLARICLDLYPAPGLDAGRLAVLTNLPNPVLEAGLEKLESSGRAFRWENDCWISAAALDACLERMLARARELHGREPLKGGFAINALASGWGEGLPEKFLRAAAGVAERRGILARVGTGFGLPGHKASLDAETAAMLEFISGRIRGATPPFAREIMDEKGWDLKTALPLFNHLCEAGSLVRLQEGVYYNKADLDGIVARISVWMEQNGALDVAAMKAILGVSRKYAIPLLEYLDAAGVTRRVGDKRVPRGK